MGSPKLRVAASIQELPRQISLRHLIVRAGHFVPKVIVPPAQRSFGCGARRPCGAHRRRWDEAADTVRKVASLAFQSPDRDFIPFNKSSADPDAGSGRRLRPCDPAATFSGPIPVIGFGRGHPGIAMKASAIH
jgi:hypothetical protein